MGLMVDLQPSFGAALVVGGGAIAARKVRALVDAGFAVTVVAPEIAADIRLLAGVALHDRGYSPSDLAGHAIVFACTGSREVNEAVGEGARAAGLPVVVADRQGESTFFSPALLREGDLTVAVSTGGAAPELARQIRERIAAALGPDWAGIVRAARLARETRLAAERNAPQHGGSK